MSVAESIEKIFDHRLIAVLRSDGRDDLLSVCDALFESGIRIIEITMTVPGAIEMIARVKERLGKKILLGAGTVLDPQIARAVIDAGAEFVVSPVTHIATIQTCINLDKLVMPGVFTPTEIWTAREAGAKIVKLFPANILGPEFLKAINGPFPEIPLLPTGGIDLDNMTAFLDAGACAVGVGGSLLDQTALKNRDWDAIQAHAEKYVQKVRQSF